MSKAIKISKAQANFFFTHVILHKEHTITGMGNGSTARRTRDALIKKGLLIPMNADQPEDGNYKVQWNQVIPSLQAALDKCDVDQMITDVLPESCFSYLQTKPCADCKEPVQTSEASAICKPCQDKHNFKKQHKGHYFPHNTTSLPAAEMQAIPGSYPHRIKTDNVLNLITGSRTHDGNTLVQDITGRWFNVHPVATFKIEGDLFTGNCYPVRWELSSYEVENYFKTHAFSHLQEEKQAAEEQAIQQHLQAHQNADASTDEERQDTTDKNKKAEAEAAVQTPSKIQDILLSWVDCPHCDGSGESTDEYSYDNGLCGHCDGEGGYEPELPTCMTCDDLGVVDMDEHTTIKYPDCHNEEAVFFQAEADLPFTEQQAADLQISKTDSLPADTIIVQENKGFKILKANSRRKWASKNKPLSYTPTTFFLVDDQEEPMFKAIPGKKWKALITIFNQIISDNTAAEPKQSAQAEWDAIKDNRPQPCVCEDLDLSHEHLEVLDEIKGKHDRMERKLQQQSEFGTAAPAQGKEDHIKTFNRNYQETRKSLISKYNLTDDMVPFISAHKLPFERDKTPQSLLQGLEDRGILDSTWGSYTAEGRFVWSYLGYGQHAHHLQQFLKDGSFLLPPFQVEAQEESKPQDIPHKEEPAQESQQEEEDRDIYTDLKRCKCGKLATAWAAEFGVFCDHCEPDGALSLSILPVIYTKQEEKEQENMTEDMEWNLIATKIDERLGIGAFMLIEDLLTTTMLKQLAADQISLFEASVIIKNEAEKWANKNHIKKLQAFTWWNCHNQNKGRLMSDLLTKYDLLNADDKAALQNLLEGLQEEQHPVTSSKAKMMFKELQAMLQM